MKKAIITGATGFIGSKLTRLLLSQGIKVLALGRKKWEDVDPLRLQKHPDLTYLQIDMSDILNLPQALNQLDWDASESVFYHFAWGGKYALSNLDVIEQYSNVVWTFNALKSAETIGCKKFIHVGTMEEAICEPYLDLDWHIDTHYNRHAIYAIAKKSARELLKSQASQSNIDLIIVTKSHVMGPNDTKDSFLMVVLQKILAREPIQMTSGEQTFDVISITDCAKAFQLIGEKGKKNAEYWIGSGNPRTLREYVERIAKLYPPHTPIEFGKISYSDVKLNPSVFSTKTLQEDIGFECSQSFEYAVEELYEWLEKGEMEKC